MGYNLGIDLGSAFTSAAVVRNGRLESVELTRHGGRIPTALYIPADGDVFLGAAALRRIAVDPARGAVGFVRRLGDPTPIVVGGAPYPAQALVARLLARIVEDVIRQYGETPDTVTVTRPAGWSEWKSELLLGALRQADLPGDPALATCAGPVAVAAFQSHRGDLGEGERCAVYDFGAGSFSATVVEAAGGGFRVVGEPAGLDELGGSAIDDAVLAHVVGVLGDAAPAEGSEAMRRLRAECVTAKEVLADDDDEVSIAVPDASVLPATSVPVTGAIPDIPPTGAGATATVRLTRAELDVVVGPAVEDTVRALRRAMRSASVDPAGLSSVLLVGGSSRLPQVAERLDAEFDGAVALVARPLGDAALGAALLAASEDGGVFAYTSRPFPKALPPVSAIPGAVVVPPAAAASVVPQTVIIGPPLPTSVPGLPVSTGGIVIGAGNDGDPDAAGAAGGGDEAGGSEPGAAARPGRSRRLVAGARRRPLIPAALVAVVAAVAVVLAVVPDWSGGKAATPAASQKIQAPSPAALRALEAAEKLPARKVSEPVVPSAEVVTVGGSVEVAPITDTAYSLFRQKQKNVQVTVNAVDTADGYDKLCSGKIDISGASYPQDPGSCTSQVTDFEVAHETLPIVVDNSNTWATCLSLSQVQAIYRKGSTINNWNQVDPNFPNVPLTVHGFDPNSVQYAVFNAAVTGGRYEGRSDYATTGDGDTIAGNVAKTKGAIGFLDYPSLAKYSGTVRGVEMNNGSGCIAPTLDNARAGRYLPLCKPLYIYVRLDALKRPAVAAFVRFYVTNSEEVATQAHYVPRATAEITDSTQRINDLTKGVPAVPA